MRVGARRGGAVGRGAPRCTRGAAASGAAPAWCLSCPSLCPSPPPCATPPPPPPPPPPPHPTPPSLPVAELVLHCNGGAASSPPSKPPPKQRRRENSEKSPHFSPEMEAAESELSTHDQLLALSQQMVRPPRPFALFDTPSLSHRQLTHATPQRSSPMPPHMVVADGRGGAVSTRRGHSDES